MPYAVAIRSLGAAAFAMHEAAWLVRDLYAELFERARRRHPARGGDGPA